MTSTLAHCLIFAAGLAAVAAPLPATSPAAPPTSHVVATGSTPVVVEIVPDAFAPPTPDEIEDFVARAPQYDA
jgi:hypothetical protein